MAQGKYRKVLMKKVRKGHLGYPLATVAFYGPNATRASKVVCGIIRSDGAEPELMKKWHTDRDVRKSEAIFSQLLLFMEENKCKSVGMVEQILGCPHEEGVDYPEGESCPKCPYWKNRDRFTHEIVH